MKMDFGNVPEDKQNKPRIVEIVGPAGAGKTTLSQMLSCCKDIHLSNFPDVRKPASLPFFMRHGLQVLSDVMLTCPGNLKQLGRRELAWLSILGGWSKRLQRESRRTNDLFVLDQGPVFLLAEMSLFGPHFLRTKNAKKLWRTWYQQWSDVLDAVVWLDAPDECLVERIRTRGKGHMVKEQPPRAIFEFLRDYRRAYQRTLSALAANRSCLKVIHFDTSRRAPEEIAAQLFIDFDLQTIPSADC